MSVDYIKLIKDNLKDFGEWINEHRQNLDDDVYGLFYDSYRCLKNDIDRIIYAIKDMNYTLFTQLYEQYINDPNIEDNLGNTLLNLAVQSNCFSITNFLLNQGADPNIANVRIIFI
jgi:ankyrin repeat protein